MNFIQILILGLVQGAAELLPVSSSAHVIVAEKLMGLDPSSPEMTFLLVMLHTGTMFAVIVYFWSSWLDHYFTDAKRLGDAATNIFVATLVTCILGLALKFIIEKVFMHGQAKAEVEELFSYLPLIGGALLAAGLLIIFSGSTEERWPAAGRVDLVKAAVIGAVQGFCLPFRGFSRSGGTISAGLLLGIERRQIEEFSFALAVVLTPIVVVMELWRLIKAHPEMTHGPALMKLLEPGLIGMVCSFVAGYLALKLLSRLLEAGRWKYFGYYCLVASVVVFALAYAEPAGATVTGPIETTPIQAEPGPTPAPAAPTTNASSLPPAPIPVMNTASPATMLPASAQQSANPIAIPTTNSAPVSP
jgi:undecaprenyl-diphosphatase